MTNCCAPGSSFPSSSLMQQLALNHPIIWEEICLIQQAILSASSQCQIGGGQMSTVVGGNTPMTFVTGVEGITVVNGGSGYVVDTPAVKFIPPLGVTPSDIATATVTTNGGNIEGITIVNPGSGYEPVPSTVGVTSLSGVGAVLLPLVNASGEIVGINVVNGGTGYNVTDTVTATRAVAANPAYIDAVLSIATIGNLGQILTVEVVRHGSGYQDSITEAKIVSGLDNDVDYPTGVGFFGIVSTNSSGAIVDVSIINAGSGYANINPYVVITDPGTGCTTQVNLSGNSVQSIDVLNPGSGYTSFATGSVLNPSTAPNPPISPAVITVNTAINTFGTNPNLYYQVWAGTASNAQIQLQINQVISYFTNLGYSIKLQSNPQTGSTLQWVISW